MRDTRPRLVAYAPSRSLWSTRCARWAADARIPFAFVRCVSLTSMLDELSGETVFALLVDTAACSSQILTAARAAGVPLVSVGRDDVDATSRLPDTFRREELLRALVVLERPGLPVALVDEEPPVTRPLVAVIGSGGAGTSTIAAVVAQGLAALDRRRPVLLADLCRNAAQAMLHDVQDSIDGVMEIGTGPNDVSSEPYLPQVVVEARGYSLVLGMRQPLQWVALRGQRAATVVSRLATGEGVVVCDLDAEVETERDTGSVGIGDRHRLTTTVLAHASVIVVVVDASLVGVMRGVERAVALAGLRAEDVPLVAVLNRRSKTDALRPAARFRAAFAALSARVGQCQRPVTVIDVPVFGADECHLRVAAFPARLTAAVAKPVHALLIDGR